MMLKPNVIPNMCGMVRRKPTLAPDVISMMLLGPGEKVETKANANSGPNKV
ncbi:Uncharacterised protein [Vibrio cholerae]|uniref:Uncharacterized protein n=1 Tax=Vibrio cholerae TaxID=666 RepID=A0A655ZB22_VIBCL|nr:Uncharacterised protein [Vibrio cholerae]CSC16136.1 Uncharacterised protein [Vibrio cholerae]CSC63123.1 Uncharacterised protein [Vibrio cholerae]CSD35307.1 Uncharacterised protein [Vibrio cholerae]